MRFNVNEIDLGLLVENMPDLIFYLDRDKQLLSFNAGGKRFLKSLGCDDPMAGDDVLKYYPKEKRNYLEQQLNQLNKGKVFSFEDCFRYGKTIYYYDISLYALTTKQGDQIGFCVLLRDVTDRKVAEESYRRLFHDNPMVIYIMRLADLKILQVNKATIIQYGYSREELLQKTAFDWRPKKDQEKLKQYLQHLIANNADGPAGVWRHVLKNGEHIYMDVCLHRIQYKNEDAIMAIAQNVTEKKLLEKKLAGERRLRQQQMTKAIIEAQETGRTEIGRELHDNVNQILGAARLYITSARQEKEHKKDEFLKKASDYTLNAIEEIRKLSRNLVSPDLHYLGLESVVGNLAEEIMMAHPITISLNTDTFDETGLHEKFKLNVFRIIQEQLNNIIKHARADKINILLSKDDNELRILITDDGKGFDTSRQRRGIGLSNIQSRVELYMGKMEIDSSPGNGCRLNLSFPCTETIR